jgi:Txe/YoeB family toxin of Txe-Axe toxin-antitoxin module
MVKMVIEHINALRTNLKNRSLKGIQKFEEFELTEEFSRLLQFLN